MFGSFMLIEAQSLELYLSQEKSWNFLMCSSIEVFLQQWRQKIAAAAHCHWMNTKEINTISHYSMAPSHIGYLLTPCEPDLAVSKSVQPWRRRKRLSVSVQGFCPSRLVERCVLFTVTSREPHLPRLASSWQQHMFLFGLRVWRRKCKRWKERKMARALNFSKILLETMQACRLTTVDPSDWFVLLNKFSFGELFFRRARLKTVIAALFQQR